MVGKAAKMMGFIKRNTKGFKRPASNIVLFNALVRSVLEFGSVIWNPRYVVHSDRIESIQRSFTRHLAFLAPGISSRCSYYDRLLFFKMCPLKRRRQMIDMLLLQNVVKGSSSYQGLLERIGINVPRVNTRRKLSTVFSIPRYRTNLGLNSPIARLMSTYNGIWKNLDLDIFHDHPAQLRLKILDSDK